MSRFEDKAWWPVTAACLAAGTGVIGVMRSAAHEVAAFLASDDARDIDAQAIEMDGGMAMSPSGACIWSDAVFLGRIALGVRGSWFVTCF